MPIYQCEQCKKGEPYEPFAACETCTSHVPNPGTSEFENMIDFMRADLASGMKLSKIIDHGKNIVESDGRNFEDNAAAYKASGGKVLLSTKGAVLYLSDADTLNKSRNNTVRRNPEEDAAVKRLYDIFASL